MNFIANLIKEEDGVTAIEYALIASLIAAAGLRPRVLGSGSPALPGQVTVGCQRLVAPSRL